MKKEGTVDHTLSAVTYTNGSRLCADTTMMRMVICNDENSSPVVRALKMNGYYRYWHGYTSVLRPLLVIADYGQIRWILYSTFAFLTFLISVKIYSDFYGGAGISAVFVTGLIMCNFYVVPNSITVSETFVVAFGAMVWILFRYRADSDRLKIWLVYLSLGMITSYIDILTTPVVTLCLPLMIQLMINMQSISIKDNMLDLIRNTVSWGIGFIGFWAVKIIIGCTVLGRDVYMNAIQRVRFFIEGKSVQKDKYSFFEVVRANLPEWLPIPINKHISVLMIIIAVAIILCLCIFFIWIYIKHKKEVLDELKKNVPTLVLSMYPFLFFLVMPMYSAEHAAFWGYRLLLVTFFGIGSVYYIVAKTVYKKKVIKKS